MSRPALARWWGDSFTKSMMFTAFTQFQPERHPEPDKEISSISPTKQIVRPEPPIFQLWCDALIHFAT